MSQDRDALLAEYDYALPSEAEVIEYIKSLESKKPSAFQLLASADENGHLLLQPRCGVGGHQAMLDLLRAIEQGAKPEILTLTIDSYTRLCKFKDAERILAMQPSTLNGYPLVAHGVSRGREINEMIAAPLEVRHGSPDARLLFEVGIASGITSFEGGGIAYNLPYSKSVPIADSLRYWQYVDRRVGQLAREGIVVDRELFGTLTAVLIPPSMSIAITLLEALLAVQEGVRYLSVAYCQSGSLYQDIAALRAIRRIFARYLPEGVHVFPVFHEFMGAFPERRPDADALILLGAIAARKGRAVKIITKTYEEAFGVPTVAANVQGIWTCRMASSPIIDVVEVSEEQIEEEIQAIEQEVDEIVAPLLDKASLAEAIVAAFISGSLDIAFSASRYAHSEVLPMRDPTGAIRYFDAGGLPLSEASKRRNREKLEGITQQPEFSLFEKAHRDIFYFAKAQERGDFHA
jgi:methylaspartate mutase epsilon subunit